MIYLITKGEATVENFSVKKKEILDIIRVAVDCNISHIQIREKNLSARLLFELTAKALKITKKSETKLLVNERFDIALAAKSDGVHLTSTAIPIEIIRKLVPKKFIVGVSTHTLTEAKHAQINQADFVTFSPIFSKNAQGLDELRKVCKALKPFPVIALGGIDKTNYQEILQIADGFAAIRFLNQAENLYEISKTITTI
ncbi:MAG: thiamine phosphate synthase [Pyrinomonadaceae bacterium]|jgi:thiamine-phosphate pyrophosphorylase|nr:thiamine phosphate synthase [Pyrinomonadaceae bacterium]